MERGSGKTMLSAAIFVAAMFITGCSETGLTPNTDFRDVVCPNTECDKTFTLESGELDTIEACYQATDMTPPDEILECLAQGGDCTITVLEGFETTWLDRACCVDEFPNYPDDPPPNSCEIEGEQVPICTEPTDLSANNLWRDAGSDLVAALQNDCDFELVADLPNCISTSERTWGDVCPDPNK